MAHRKSLFLSLASACENDDYKRFFTFLSEGNLPNTLRYHNGSIKRKYNSTKGIPISVDNLDKITVCLADEFKEFIGEVEESVISPVVSMNSYHRRALFTKYLKGLWIAQEKEEVIAQALYNFNASKDFRSRVVFDEVTGEVVELPTEFKLDADKSADYVVLTEREFVNF